MRTLARAAGLVVALWGAGCAAQLETVERVRQGPKAQELFLIRSYLANGREPSFDEKRMWEDQVDERVARYLREHPELERSVRYSDFRFWRQVTVGSTRSEVRVLLEAPEEETIDPALMGALAKRHWSAIQSKVTEAWVYAPGWVLYFDGEGVVEVVRRVGRFAADE